MAGRAHPAHPGRAPDDRRRPVPAAGRAARARSPSRSCATWTPSATSVSTAPTWRSAPTPTAPILHDARGHPLDRAGQALPDRDALHRGRLRPAARAGLRADARAARRRGRRDPLRHQRPALADPRRLPDPRRDARGPRPVVGRRGLDQGGPRHRPRGRRVDDLRPLRDRRLATATSPASTRTRRTRAHVRAAHRARRSTRPTASSTPASSTSPTATQRLAPDVRLRSRSSARCSSRPPAGSARSGTSPTPACSRSTATP